MTHITRLPRAAGLNDLAHQIENDLGELTREHRPAHQNPQDLGREFHTTSAPTPLPMPDYVEHREEVSEVGKLSAQAVAAEYESAAVDIEKLAQGLIEMAAKCNEDTEMVIKHNKMVRAKIEEQVTACMAAAQLYRDEAKMAFDKIQTQSLLIDDARRTLQAMRERIQSGQPKVEVADAHKG